MESRFWPVYGLAIGVSGALFHIHFTGVSDLTSAERRIWGIGMANKLRLLIGYPIDDERNPGESLYDSEQIRKGASWALNFVKEEAWRSP